MPIEWFSRNTRKIGGGLPLGAGLLLTLALLGGCSSSQPARAPRPKSVKIELAAPTDSPSRASYLPFVSLGRQRTQKLVTRIVQKTNQDLAETRSAVQHLQEEEISGQFTPSPALKKPVQDILEPGLVSPMPKVRLSRSVN